MNITNSDPLTGPAAALLLVALGLQAPFWAVLPLACVLSFWVVKGTWDNRKL